MKPPREIPDELWEEIQKIIPPRPDRSKGGRKPVDDRVLFNGIFFVLRTGAAWREMPEKYGPLSVAVTAANINDHIALPELLKNYAVVRPRPTYAKPQHICLDAAFDNELTRQIVCREYYVPHIAPRGGRPEDIPQHSGGQARRWVVERTHAWFDRFRRLVVNWEKTIESRYAFLCLGLSLFGPFFVWRALSSHIDSSLRTRSKTNLNPFSSVMKVTVPFNRL